MDYTQFAQNIKQKYPQYKNVDDRELAQRIVQKYPQYISQVQFQPSIMSSMGKISNNYHQSQMGSPQELLGMIPPLMEKGAGKLGQMATEQLSQGKNRLDPYTAAGVGTAISMAPDVLMSLAPTEENPQQVSEAAVPWARRALGFSKRFLKSPFARNTANEAGRVALQEGVIPKMGSADVMMERAENLRKTAAQEMDAAFNKAFEWVGGSKPTRAKVSGIQEAIIPSESKSLAPITQEKGLTLNTPTKATEAKKAGDLGAETTTFEKKARFISKKRIMDAMRGLAPKGIGGFWNEDRKLINKAMSTVAGMGRGGLLTLEDANTVKSKLQSLASYGQPGYDLIKSLAAKTREIVDTSLDEFGQKIGDPNLSSQFMRAKFKYAAASRMQEGLNNKLSSEMGNMPISVPSLMMGGAEMAAGRPVKGAMTMGGAEFLKRRGAGMAARGINAVGTGLARSGKRVPGLINSIMAKKRQYEDSNP